MTTIITSQHYLNDEIVTAKIAANDYAVLVSPVFTFDGREFQVLLDGHHSFAAARAAGAELEITEATTNDHDAVGILIEGDIEGFLEAVHAGEGDYIDARTGISAW